MAHVFGLHALLAAALLLHSGQTARMWANTQKIGWDENPASKVIQIHTAYKKQLINEQKLLEDAKTQLARDRQSLTDKRVKQKQWKEINGGSRWGMFASELRLIDGEIKELEEGDPILEKKVQGHEDQVRQLTEAAADAHRDVAKVAADFEQEIAELKEKLAQSQADYDAAVVLHKQSAKIGTDTAREIMQKLEEAVVKKEQELEELKAELDALKNGEHGLHKELSDARAAHNRIITEKTTRIGELTDEILRMEQQEKEAESAQKNSLGDFAKTLNELAAMKAVLVASKKSVEDEMQSARDNLAATEQETEANISSRTKELEDLIKKLEGDRDNAIASLQNQKSSNRDALLELDKSHKEALAKIALEIQTTKDEIKRVSNSLEEARASLSNSDEAGRTLLDQLAAFQKDKQIADELLAKWSLESKRLQSKIDEASEASEAVKSQKEKAQASIDANEETLTKLEGDLVEEKTLHSETKSKQEQEIENQKAEDKSEETSAQANIDKLTEKIKTLKAELTSITDGTHTLHEKLEEAKKAIQEVIDQYQETLEYLASAIELNERQTTQTEAARQDLNNDFNDAIKVLADQKARLEAEKKAAETSKANAEQELASTVAKGKAGIEALRMKLERDIENLNEELRIANEAGENQGKAIYQQYMAVQAAANEKESNLQKTIGDYKGSKEDAEESLRMVQAHVKAHM